MIRRVTESKFETVETGKLWTKKTGWLDDYAFKIMSHELIIQYTRLSLGNTDIFEVRINLILIC